MMPILNGLEVVQAKSGTGKTANILISVLQRLDMNVSDCQAIIIAPIN